MSITTYLRQAIAISSRAWDAMRERRVLLWSVAVVAYGIGLGYGIWPLVTVGSLVLLIGAAWRVGEWMLPGDGWFACGVIGALTVTGAAMVFGTGGYFFASLTRGLVFVILCMISAVAMALPVPRRASVSVVAVMPSKETCDPMARALLMLAGGVDLALLVLLGRARTDIALASPWTVLSWAVFLMYGVATAALVLASLRTRSRWVLGSAVLHSFVIYGVVTIVYAVGFGYDPFIHRAAEMHIADWGVLLPKQPYYLGQYVVVVALHWLTHLPIRVIDILLVPLLVVMGMTSVFAIALPRGWGVPRHRVGHGLLLTLLIPALPFVFTVPYHLSVVLAVMAILLLPVARTCVRLWWCVCALALAALAAHPLVGAPLVLLVVGFGAVEYWGTTRARRVILLVMVTCGQVMLLPALFAWHNLRVGAPAFRPGNPFLRWQLVVDLFRDPFVVAWPVPWTLEALYGYRQWAPWFLAVAGVVGCVIAGRAFRARAVLVIPASAIGLLGAVAVLATTHTIPGVVAYEQQEFVLRLLATIPLLLMPGLAVLGVWCVERLPTDAARIAWAIGLAGAATVSWYLTYPQVNQKAVAAGWGASAADVAVVDAIERSADAPNTLVLANQMVVAVAVERHGFGVAERYPLPSQARSAYFFRIAYEGVISSDLLEAARRDAGVDRVAVVLHAYWPWYHLLSTQLAEVTGNSRSFGDDAIRLFVWDRPE